MEGWSRAEARSWSASRRWVCGFNFIPSTAVNFLEMWHADSFDRSTIERELGWGADIGFNAIRINTHFLVWQHDRDGLLERLDWVMAVAARSGIDTVPCLFDDCGFGGLEPEYGPQPDPVPGVHNSRAVASPGRALVMDRRRWDALESYLRDIVRSFRTDERVLFWDLYNEPGNRMIFRADGYSEYDPGLTGHSRALMEASFRWARAESPSQPLTVAAWSTPLPGSGLPPYQTEIDAAALALSDVVSFHAYWNTAHVSRFIAHLETRDRPMFCTEWMARAVDSRIDDQLRLFRDRGIGCFQWGFVRGRTQTHLPWPPELVASNGGLATKDVWFHDVLHEDGRPYDPKEIETVKELTEPYRRKLRNMGETFK
jgi:hypothetical protein